MRASRNACTYSIESQKTPEFDASVEVTKGNVKGYENHIRWVAEEMAPELHSFAENKCPHCQCNEERLSLVGRPLLRCFVPRIEDEEVVRKCPSGDGRLEY